MGEKPPQLPILISVVIPVLNEEKLLPRLLAILTPELCKYKQLEVIVSDGGSTDSTLAIAAGHHAAIIIPNITGNRQTIAEGRNWGAAAATGKVICFINGDTLPENPTDFFAIIHQWAYGQGKHRKAAALACPVYISPDERRWSDFLFHTFFNEYLRFLINILKIGIGRGECQIVKREVFEKVGGYNPLLVAGEDFDLFRRIAMTDKVKFAKNLPVHESPRRFRRYGYFKILASWTINALSVIAFGRSVNKEWEAVR
ncbi:MAG: glycosyltransferase [Ignavibacteriae bacterium]|nr:glycosyltransferase [Ignavibacteriota bacterium]